LEPGFAVAGGHPFFSTATFAASNTGSILGYILRALHLSLTARQFLLLHVAIRKTAHFTVYGILSALFFRAWRGGAQRRTWKWTWAILALAVCLVAASSDEYHQSFTPGRTAAVSDVILDMMGATFAQLMIVVFASSSRRPR
jgi:VanZ family protein